MTFYRLAIFSLVLLFCFSCRNKEEQGTRHEIISVHTDHSKHDHAGHDHTMDEIEAPENTKRENWQKPNAIIGNFDMSEKVVADIGAGTGYFTFRMAPAVKKVIAIDVDERALKYINEKKGLLPDNYGDRIETRLAEYHDPKLKEKEADFVLLVNTYYLIQDRISYFKNLYKCVNDNGQLVIVDYKKEDFPIGPPTKDKLSAEKVKEELTTCGFKEVSIDKNSLEYQYIITAAK